MSLSEPGGSSQPPSGPPPPPPPQGYPPPPGYGYGYAPSGAADDLGRPLAAWWKRLLAILLDSVILFVPTAILFAVLGLVTVETNDLTGEMTVDGGALGLTTLIGLVVTLAYFGLLDGGARGQTVGKMALGIQVRDATSDGPIGVGRAVLRRFIYQVVWYVLVIPGLLNVLWPLWDRKRQAWHDMVANSVVVDASR